MGVCESCGKKISVLNDYKIDGVKLCYDCASKVSEEKLKKGANAFILDNKELAEQIKNDTVENEKTIETTKEIKPIINQVISDANRIVNENGNLNDSSFWIKFLKTAAKIEFILSIIGGIVGAFAIGIDYGDFEGFLIGLAVLLGAAIASIIVFATEMVFLNLAEDVSVIRKTITKNQKDQ